MELRPPKGLRSRVSCLRSMGLGVVDDLRVLASGRGFVLDSELSARIPESLCIIRFLNILHYSVPANLFAWKPPMQLRAGKNPKSLNPAAFRLGREVGVGSVPLPLYRILPSTWLPVAGRRYCFVWPKQWLLGWPCSQRTKRRASGVWGFPH